MVSDLEELLNILPAWMGTDVHRLLDSQLKEIHLRMNKPPEIISRAGRQFLRRPVSQEDLKHCINAASRYSPWAASSIGSGYLTLTGGHRMGICGEVVLHSGTVTGCREIRSLCIRVARDLPGIAAPVSDLAGSVLILGAPGWGKTTLLRDLIRQRARKETVAVVDERGELFPPGFDPGLQTDVLSGCPKPQGILRLLRTMSPQTIAVDEITDPEDCGALIQAFHCGVSLFATAHAVSLSDLSEKALYQPLLLGKLFQHVLILREDQTYLTERIQL